MPGSTTAKTHLILTGNASNISFTGTFWSLESLLAIWRWTSLQLLVCTNLNVLKDILIDVDLLLGAESLNLFLLKLLGTARLHTCNSDGFSRFNMLREMRLYTVLTEFVHTFLQLKHFFFSIVTVTYLALLIFNVFLFANRIISST